MESPPFSFSSIFVSTCSNLLSIVSCFKLSCVLFSFFVSAASTPALSTVVVSFFLSYLSPFLPIFILIFVLINQTSLFDIKQAGKHTINQAVNQALQSVIWLRCMVKFCTVTSLYSSKLDFYRTFILNGNRFWMGKKWVWHRYTVNNKFA